MALEKWEYQILVVPTDKEYSLDKRKDKALAALERAGAQGWEAVGVTEAAGTWTVLLKRRLPA
jgi:hypothetical protein